MIIFLNIIYNSDPSSLKFISLYSKCDSLLYLKINTCKLSFCCSCADLSN